MTFFCAKAIVSKRQERSLFAPVSFALGEGDLLTITGENGRGKSTLLKILAGFTEPTQGAVLYKTQSIFPHPLFFWENIHYLGHANGLKLGLTVEENLKLIQHLNLNHSTNTLDDIGSHLNLLTLFKKKAGLISQGEKRRVALAKLLLIEKPLWILDEPLAALDHQYQTLFTQCLKHHLASGNAAIITTHQSLPLAGLSLTL